MFQITDRAYTPDLPDRFLAAHQVAHQETLRMAHEHLQQVATEGGLNPAALIFNEDGGESYIGIAQGAAGDEMFDREYGTDETPPSPILRQTFTALKPELDAHYRSVLHRELGF